MTTIAWDGDCLAVDRQMTEDRLAREITKLHIAEDRTWAAVAAGDMLAALQMIRWFSDGAVLKDYPKKAGRHAILVVLTATAGLVEYTGERGIPYPVEDPVMAWGSGGPYALGALSACTAVCAVQAVQVASRYDICTSEAVDFITLGELVPAAEQPKRDRKAA